MARDWRNNTDGYFRRRARKHLVYAAGSRKPRADWALELAAGYRRMYPDIRVPRSLRGDGP